MMVVVKFLLLLSICVIACAMPCEDIKPLVFPITDVQILPGNAKSLTKGIPASVGTPRQNIVLLPWPELNNTWIYDEQPYCDSSIIFNDVICQVRRGNLYSEANSSSDQKFEDIPSAGGAPIEVQGKGAELGISKLLSTSVAIQDDLSIGTVEVASTFPFGVPRQSWDHGYTISHALGLGSNSTLLNTLIRTGQIGSRVWSIFWGRMWVDPQDAIDGSLVLGGYDTQKVIGRNYTQPLDFSDTTGCWTGMKVHISSVKLNVRTGSDIELLPQNSAIASCIVPQRQLLLEGPQTIIDGFENNTGMTIFGLHWGAYLYKNDKNIFDGDITISLSSGLDVRIPNNQYLVPFVEVNGKGNRVFNDSRREFLVSTVYDNPSTLGRYFLTGAYLMVNHDAGTFTMWEANPTRESSLTSVISADADTKCGNDTSPVSPSDDSHTPTPTPIPGLSAGGIAGIAVGIVAALLVFGAGAYFFYKKRRRIHEDKQMAETSNVLMGDKDASGFPLQSGHGHHPYELHEEAKPQGRPELAGTEQRPQNVYEM